MFWEVREDVSLISSCFRQHPTTGSPEDVKKSNIKPPSVVVVGEVVNLRQGLDWLGAENGKLLINNIHPPIIEKQTG